MTEQTPGQRATAKARERSIVSRKKAAARRHLERHVEALTLLGYTVIPPETGEPVSDAHGGQHVRS